MTLDELKKMTPAEIRAFNPDALATAEDRKGYWALLATLPPKAKPAAEPDYAPVPRRDRLDEGE